jgi:hypothetical protein
MQVDTAGWMERSGKEKGPASLSVVQSRKNLMRAHIVALVLDAEKVLMFIRIYTSLRPKILTNMLLFIWLRFSILILFVLLRSCGLHIRNKRSCWYDELILLIIYALWPVTSKLSRNSVLDFS